MLMEQSAQGIIRAIPHQPCGPTWQWTIQGTRSHWWLYVQDDREPELRNHPYYLDPVADPEFFYLATLTTHEDISAFMTMVLTHMDEGLCGQGETLLAYEVGATADNPPWVHTTEPG